jgi:hypothetical protein
LKPLLKVLENVLANACLFDHGRYGILVLVPSLISPGTTGRMVDGNAEEGINVGGVVGSEGSVRIAGKRVGREPGG